MIPDSDCEMIPHLSLLLSFIIEKDLIFISFNIEKDCMY